MQNQILLYGFGSHAQAVLDLRFAFKNQIVGYVDLVPKNNDYQLDFFKVDVISENSSRFTFLPGLSYFDNTTRDRYARIIGELASYKLSCPIIDETAVVSKTAKIGLGTVVFPGAIIGRNVIIGDGCVINSGAIIEHDSVIGDYCHVAPSATICGGVSIGKFSLIGAGSTIINNIVLDDWSLIKAGLAISDKM